MINKIRIVKLKEAKYPLYPDNIIEGYSRTGLLSEEPAVGECFCVGDFRTSTVQKIIDKNTFETFNSIYHIIREDTRYLLIEKTSF